MSVEAKGKPARLQIDPDTIPDDDKPPQTGSIFNIWYLKWSGGGDTSRNYTKSKFRVNIKKDSGYTRGTYKSPICLFFARGCCYLGKKCPYLHRLPNENDYFIPTQDCFGRDRTADYKDDMTGVGSFNRSNRTLYVGGLHMSDKIENSLSKHFQEFGSIEKIRVLYNKGCAFVSYKLESEAQFAKEAMQNQSLDNDEILNIRWANEDPNPEAQRREKRRLEEVALNTVKNLLDNSNKRGKFLEDKNSRITVEEPTKEDEKPNETQRVIEEAKPSPEPSFFNRSSLDALKNMKRKKEPKLEKKDISILLGYSSSEDE